MRIGRTLRIGISTTSPLRGTWHPLVFSSNKWIARQPFWADAHLNCLPTYAQERQIMCCYQDSFFAKLRDHCSNLPTSISAFNLWEGFKPFKGLRAGKRQAWTPIRSHWCGLGVPVGCGMRHAKKMFQRLKGLKRPWGSFCLRGWAFREVFAKFSEFLGF